MLDHAQEAVRLVSDRTREDLDKDRVLGLALVRLMEIVGEAASRVSREACDKYPEIPWPEIVSLRNRLIHGYDEVDFDVLWGVVIADLPQLISDLQRILENQRES